MPDHNGALHDASVLTTLTTRSQTFETEEKKRAAKLIPFPEPNAEAHAQAETERKRKLFEWADRVLLQLGLAAEVAQAQSLDELRKITLDIDDVDIALAMLCIQPLGRELSISLA